MKNAPRVVVVLLLVVAFSHRARSAPAVVSAASCSAADISAAVAAAASGDTVQVPAGTCTWAGPLTVTKNISMRGAGTVLKAGFSNYDGYLLAWRGSGAFEFMGFTVDGGAKGYSIPGGWNAAGTGGMSVGGQSITTGLSVHDNIFTHCAGRAFNDRGLAYGVVYQNQFVDNFIDIDSGGVEQAGWDAPFNYGDGNTVFFESNTFTKTSDTFRGQVTYTEQGGRMVVRYNAFVGFIDFDVMDNHGNLGPDVRTRGFVGGETYENTFAIRNGGTYNQWRAFYHRGGQLLVYNNRFTDDWLNGSIGFELTEEDGWQAAFGCPCPIRDKVANSYVTNNTYNGVVVGPYLGHAPPDDVNLSLGRDYFNSGLPAGYVPFPYPHPARGGNVQPPPTITLAVSYAGKTRDVVKMDESLNGDGQLDAGFNAVMSSACTVVSVLLKSQASGVQFDTVPGNGIWTLGVTATPTGPLVNVPDGTVIYTGSAFSAFASDEAGALFPAGQTYALSIACSDGRGASASVVLPPPNQGTTPTATFTATPTSITLGQASTLAWSTTDATTVSIDNGIGTVTATGTKAVSPLVTTTYTLTASGAGGVATKAVAVAVTQPPPPLPDCVDGSWTFPNGSFTYLRGIANATIKAVTADLVSKGFTLKATRTRTGSTSDLLFRCGS